MDADAVSSSGSLGGDAPEIHPSTGRQDESSATDHPQQHSGPDIRIGPSGNPVGSVGLILDATNKMVERGSKPQLFGGKALEVGQPGESGCGLSGLSHYSDRFTLHTTSFHPSLTISPHLSRNSPD